METEWQKKYFYIYRQKDYFDMGSYSLEKFKMYMICWFKDKDPEFAERFFNKSYSSPIYGFTTQLKRR